MENNIDFAITSRPRDAIYRETIVISLKISVKRAVNLSTREINILSDKAYISPSPPPRCVIDVRERFRRTENESYSSAWETLLAASFYDG